MNKTVDFYPFFGYSPNKTVEGDLVYVNNGFLSDYIELEKMNISVAGKIVLTKAPFVSMTIKIVALELIRVQCGT